MSSRSGVRMLLSLAGALAVSVALFLFMQQLIDGGQRERVPLAVYQSVDIIHNAPEPEQPDESQDVADEVAPEAPETEALTLAPTSPEAESPPELPALDSDLGALDINTGDGQWQSPLAGGINVGGGVRDASGFVEVVPFDTRRPNVPEVAWRNKVDGWVLVAFSVTPQGHTKDIRVLDARPRGIFEEKVIAAVKDWRYSISFSGKHTGTVVMTQKVEVSWRNYPQNLPNVD